MKKVSPASSFRNSRGERTTASFVTATHAKNEFSRVLETVIQGNVIVITKHDAPKAVLLPVEEYNALTEAAERSLQTLSDEFDALLARMQKPGMRERMQAAFGASPKELGRAALAAARKRE